MKRSVRGALLTAGAALMISVAALTEPVPGVFAQAVPSPSPSPAAAPAASPAATTTPPRAGGFPLEMAWPMVAGGAAALGAGALLLRRGKR